MPNMQNSPPAVTTGAADAGAGANAKKPASAKADAEPRAIFFIVAPSGEKTLELHIRTSLYGESSSFMNC